MATTNNKQAAKLAEQVTNSDIELKVGHYYLVRISKHARINCHGRAVNLKAGQVKRVRICIEDLAEVCGSLTHLLPCEFIVLQELQT